jgi:tryptophan synthase beta subunit
VGPEHSFWKDENRAQYMIVDDAQALDAFKLLSETEGIIPALESSHAVAGALIVANEMSPDEHLLINLSGRGDKDVEEVQRLLSQ